MIIILGGSGYVGQEYQKLLIDKGIPYRSLKRSEVDYTNPAILTEALRVTKAQFLINAAGYTGKPNVDACEINKSECLDGNATIHSWRAGKNSNRSCQRACPLPPATTSWSSRADTRSLPGSNSRRGSAELGF